MKIKTAFLFLFTCFVCHVGAQRLTTQGKEFYVSFFENRLFDNLNTSFLLLTSKVNSSGTVKNPSTGYSQPFTITAGTVTQLAIPFSETCNTVSGIVSGRGLIISAVDTITAFALSSYYQTSDVTALLPTEALGMDYRVASYNGSNSGGWSFYSCFLVVGTQDNTAVEITPSVTTADGHPPGVPFTVMLDKGQAYYCTPQDMTAPPDLSGSRILVTNGCKPVAVFSGSEDSGVPVNAYSADLLWEQLFPVASFGKNFVTCRLKGRNVYRYRVYAAYDNTTVSVNGTLAATINAGGFYEMESANQAESIVTGKPAQVMLFAPSGKYDSLHGPVNQGDPTMITIVPVEQQVKQSVFLSPAIGTISAHKVSIICRTAEINNTYLDFVNVASAFSPVTGNPVYSEAAFDLSAGQHSITNSGGFVAYAYGFGDYQGYGYFTGASVEKIKTYFACNSVSSFEPAAQVNTCTGQTLFDIIAAAPDAAYVWDFGDGSPVVSTAGNVLQQQHNYALQGDYTVKLTVTGVAANNCSAGDITSTVLLVHVVPAIQPSLTITSTLGNRTCPGSVINFAAIPADGGAAPVYQWKINGVAAGSNNSFYSSVGLKENDIVACTMTGSLSCSNNPVTASSVIHFSQNAAAAITITTPINPLCSNVSASFSAVIGNNSLSPLYQWRVNALDAGTNSPVFSYAPREGDMVTCSLSVSNGCLGINNAVSNTIVMKLASGTAVNATVSISGAPVPYCQRTRATFSATPINGGAVPSFQWKLNGADVGNNAPVYVTDTLKDNDLIECLMTSSAGCVLNPVAISNAIIAEVQPSVTGRVTIQPAALAVCQDEMVDFKCAATIQAGGGALIYDWLVNGRSVKNGPDSVYNTASLSDGDRVNCVIRSNSACLDVTYTGESVVKIYPKPQISFAKDSVVIPFGASAPLAPIIAGTVSFFLWSPVLYLNDPFIINPVATPVKNTEYTLMAKNAQGCTSTKAVTVLVFKDFIIPNAFSPNGDGNNDVFRIPIQQQLIKIHFFVVFNRYGQKVFDTEDPKQGWDGTAFGKLQDPGTYTWIIKYENPLNRALVSAKGTVILMR